MPNRFGHATEAEEQVALFQWAAYYPELKFMFAVPNGGSRNAIEAHNLKLQGVKSGVPDICLPLPKGKYHGLYIELKVEKNKTSKNQDEWLKYLENTGYKTALCYGFEEARKTILKYLKSEAEA
jgi:hypothetical protein